MQNSEESAIGIMLSSLEMMEGVNIHEEYEKIIRGNSRLSALERDEAACRKQMYNYYDNENLVMYGSERCKTCVERNNLKALIERKIIPTRNRLCGCGTCTDISITLKLDVEEEG